MSDNVNHPSHYETGKYECIDVMIETHGIEAVKNFCICNAFKYLYRHENKNGVEDVRKAKWYLDKYLELVDSAETDVDLSKVAKIPPLKPGSFLTEPPTDEKKIEEAVERAKKIANALKSGTQITPLEIKRMRMVTPQKPDEVFGFWVDMSK